MVDDPEAREEGFYWVVLGQNPPEIAYWAQTQHSCHQMQSSGAPGRQTPCSGS
jgi:hypothetical protein